MLLISASAFAQLDPDQRKCSDAFNKALRNVGNQEQKNNRKACVKEGGGEACVAATGAKATEKRGKVNELFDVGGKCETALPFGVVATPGNGDDAVDGILEGTDTVIRDIFGDPVDGVTAGDKCQDSVAKRSGKIYDSILKAFRKCAKELASIDDIGDLEGCIGTAAVDAKVGTFQGKLTNDITNKCAASPPLVAGAEDGECGAEATAAAFSLCATSSVKCNACQALNTATGGNADCDTIDDGTANGSCGTAVCGDGIVRAPFGEECDPPGVNSPDCPNAGDTCSATCECETPVCGNNLIEFGEECDPPGGSSCPFAGDTCNGTCGCEVPAGVHRCTFNGAVDNSALQLCFLGSPCIAPNDTSGAVDVVCDPLSEDVNGKRDCQCTLRQFDPVPIPGAGFACIDPVAGCPDGELECDGGNALNIEAEANHQIGLCTSNADCDTQCGTFCSGMGKTVYHAGCESYCQGGVNEDLLCQCDVLGALTCHPSSTLDCPGSSCEGKDNETDNDCHCTCIDEAVPPASGAGQIACKLGVAIRVESSLPCDNTGVIARLAPQCAPFTSGTASNVVIDLNEFGATYGPFSETGTDGTCAAFDTSVMTGYELVSVLAFYDSTLGDLVSRLTVDCQ